MRVTSEMLEAAVLEFRARTGDDDEEVSEVMLAVLSTALADVPEPGDTMPADSWKAVVRECGETLRLHQARIAELEAQLAEQREHQRKCTVVWQAAEEKLFLARVWNRKSCDGVAQAQLDAILDGREGT